jgi:hypothetical protein
MGGAGCDGPGRGEREFRQDDKDLGHAGLQRGLGEVEEQDIALPQKKQAQRRNRAGGAAVAVERQANDG